MNRGETIKILAVLKGAYPAFYRDMGRQELESIVALWQEMFDEPYALVAAAVKALIAVDAKGYPPHIGAVKARIRQISQPRGMSGEEAWRLVEAAASNGQYGAEAEFQKLPQALQTLVKSPEQLRQWATMDGDTFRTVIGSNFQRSYREVVQYEREISAMPPDVRALAEQISNQPESAAAKALKGAGE